MIELELQLHYDSSACHEVAAYLLNTRDPFVVLEEIARWSVPQGGLKILPLRGDGDSSAVLVILDPKGVPTVPVNGVPFGVVAENMFLPVHSQLTPPLLPGELAQLTNAECYYVWLPRVGLVVAEAVQVLRVHNLIELLEPRSSDWSRAEVGVAANERLLSIEPAESLSIEEALGGGQSDIGRDAKDIKDLPPSPEEPGSGIGSRMIDQGRRGLASAIRWMIGEGSDAPSQTGSKGGVTRGMGGGGTGLNSGMFGGLVSWANGQLKQVADNLQARRNKELLRLLSMLDKDPDQGLRFALPMGGGAHRGIAQPGASLTSHDINFSLGGLGGGGRADFWDIPPEYQNRLMARYRELAERELGLRRYRRAAYIYAELLGDYQAAASALKTGRHFREAAVLYRERFGSDRMAAECYEQGGLWTDALEMYLKLKNYLKAGEIYERLEQREEAEEVYRKEVAVQRDRGELIAAAEVLRDRLGATDEAIEVLRSGWPDSHQNSECLRREFELLSEIGEHGQAKHRISELTARSWSPAANLILANSFSDLATGHVDRDVRTLACQATKVHVSRCLTEGRAKHTSQLVAAVRRLVPNDKLLARDCDRYVSCRTSNKRESNSRPKRKHIHTIHLPANISWEKATVSGDLFFVAGYGVEEVHVAGVSVRSGQVDSCDSWRVPPESMYESLMLATSAGQSSIVAVHVFGMTQPLETKRRTYNVPTQRIVVIGGNDNFNEMTFGMARGNAMSTWTLEPNTSAELELVSRNDANGSIRRRPLPGIPKMNEMFLQLAFHANPDKIFPARILECRGVVFVAIANKLICMKGGKSQVVDIDTEITHLSASLNYSLTRIAVCTEQGGYVYWPAHDELIRFADDQQSPRAAFIGTGQLVSVGDGECRVYSTANCKVRHEQTFQIEGADCLEVLPCTSPHRFAVFDGNSIRVYEV